MTHSADVTTLFVYFLGVALCFWRSPSNRGDRGHLTLCLTAALLWGGLLLFNPATRKPHFALTTGAFLMISLLQRSPRADSK